MQSRLTALLTMATLAITLIVAAALVISPTWAAGLALVTGAAIAATLLVSRPTAITRADTAVGPVLAAIVLELALATCRYAGGVPMLAEASPGLFGGVTDATWFVSFVVLPLGAMLLGARYLVVRSPLGIAMAWWTALYTLADALLQIRIVVETHPVAHLAGTAVALAQLLVAIVIFQRLLRPAVAPAIAIVMPSLRLRNLWTLLFVCAVVLYGATLFSQAGPLPVMPIVGSMMGGLVGWRKTTALRPADPATALPLFLVLLALFYLHIGEEALTSFNQAIASISGTPWDDRAFTLLIGLVGPIVWFSSALSLWRRQAFGNFIFWFLIVGMILGEPMHLVVFPVMAMHSSGGSYEYFPGMYTALFPMVPAIVALVTIVRDHRSCRAVQS